MRRTNLLRWATGIAVVLGAVGVRAQEKAPEPKAAEAAAARAGGDGPGRAQGEKKFADFNEITRGSEKIDGLFTLHRKDEHLYAEVRSNQLDQPLLAPINIVRGMAMAGQPLNFGDQWVVVFKRVGDKIQVVRRNLQREHLKKLSSMVLGARHILYDDMFEFLFVFGAAESPADAKSLARLHMEEISGRIARILEQADSRIDDTTRAHLKELRTRIIKVLDASLDLNEP